MSATCYACTLGLARVGQRYEEDPVGNCWMCHVFACHGHGSIDRGKGKFLCSTTVQHGLAQSSGVTSFSGVNRHEDEVPIFSGRAAFERRFPVIAAALAEAREFWAYSDGPLQLVQRLSIERNLGTVDRDLAIDALALASYLVGLFEADGGLIARSPDVADELFDPLVGRLLLTMRPMSM